MYQHPRFFARVIKVDSPSLIWIQLHHAREDLEELIDDLTSRMARRGRGLILNPDHALPDEYVAVQEGRTWQRGVIINLEGKHTVMVALRDWGRVIQRPVTDMYILEDRFRELNWQAISCGLVGARSRWSRNSRALTRLLLGKREGWMRILEFIEDYAAIITLELKRESEDETSSLKDLLISMGCALHTESSTNNT
ncbi:hypothetical protein ALC57_18625 [Trachymyrmex cornetzi]|uniref:Tudor domain-containing protein n=1 Tax=Trachymyrmex cornetzi TaxID=471704 RepID=A0A151IRH2_9HYME|nr:hypothetical protein ALC57_18625 [Trachymyrmex cornetzi]